MSRSRRRADAVQDERGQPLGMLARVEALAGRHADVERAVRRLIALGKANSLDWNALVWESCFAHRSRNKSSATREPASASRRRRGISTALAMAYAEIGKISEARDVLWQGAELGGEDFDPGWWLVIGSAARRRLFLDSLIMPA